MAHTIIEDANYGLDTTCILKMGSFGQIVLGGIDKKTNMPVAATKIMKSGYLDTRILMEMAPRLRNHDNVVKILGYSEDPFAFYLIQEFCEMGNLEGYCRDYRPGPPTAIKISVEISVALSYSRHNQIMHRDVKPENIMMTYGIPNRDRPFAKLAYGMANVQLGGMGQTLTTVVAGTQAYVAPEIIEGRRYSHEADVYACGRVIYWLIDKCNRIGYDDINAEVKLVAQQMTQLLPDNRILATGAAKLLLDIFHRPTVKGALEQPPAKLHFPLTPALQEIISRAPPPPGACFEP